MTGEKGLHIDSLAVSIGTGRHSVEVVSDLCLDLPPQRSLALVGESGCGKSMTALAIMGLLPPTARIAAGTILLDETEIHSQNDAEMAAVRGLRAAMIFQEPMSSLNPLMTVGGQITEGMEFRQGLPRAQARQKAMDLLSLVGFSKPGEVLDEYPHRLSGGMRQRIMIALALACGPKLIIADEPTTALDVTIQAQVLDVLKHAVEVTGASLLLITHDLAVVHEMADRVAVMYAGMIVESAPEEALFLNPLHPYTQALLSCIPNLDGPIVPLRAIQGSVPDPATYPTGCRFHPRCPQAFALCTREVPLLREAEPGRLVRCHLFFGGVR